jgi:parvulin-like peptidyl-prolyl isomerase
MNDTHQEANEHESKNHLEDHDKQDVMSKKEKRACPRKAFFCRHKKKFAIGLVVFLVIFGLVSREVYHRPVSDGFVRAVSSIVPYPAMSVGDTTITIREYLQEYDALVSFFTADEEGATPSESALEEAISETLVNKIAVKKLADQYELVLDEEQIEEYFQGILSAQESEEAFAAELDVTFGWTVEEFKERVVASIVLAFQVSDFVLESEEIQQERVDAINSAYARIQEGEDFSVVAKEVHAMFDESLESDLGYVKLSAIPSAWVSSVENLNQGEYTEVLTLDEGFAIFLVNDSIVAGEDTQLHLLAVTVQKRTVEDVVAAYVEAMEIKNYID